MILFHIMWDQREVREVKVGQAYSRWVAKESSGLMMMIYRLLKEHLAVQRLNSVHNVQS